MKGSQPEQAVFTRDTDMTNTDETRRVIEGMADGPNDHRIADTLRRIGNQGCGSKAGLRAFQEIWQAPFQAALGDKVCIDEARLRMGEWAAAFGRQEATHRSEFMGIPPTGKRVQRRDMDFWEVVDVRIADHRVVVGFPNVMAQLGVDVLGGHGWDALDRGDRVPSAPPPASPVAPSTRASDDD